MSTNHGGGFVTWVGGIVGTVISGVIVFALTYQPATTPEPTDAVLPPTTSTIPTQSVDFSVTDQLGEGQISERISVFVNDRSVGTLTVDVVHANASLMVTVPKAGTYSYRLEGSIVVEDDYGGPVVLTGYGVGGIEVSNGRAFALAGDYSSDPVRLTFT